MNKPENPYVISRDEAVDRLVELALSSGPLAYFTDKYFTNTRRIVEAKGDMEVTYAVFLRQRCIAALEPAERLIRRLVPEAEVTRFYREGEVVPADRKLMEVRGPMSKLSEAETPLLQKVGFPSISAVNAYEMCLALPDADFIDMHARHGSGVDMNMLAAYGASVGSDAARSANPRVKGFIGSSQDATAPMYGSQRGIGTMPHSLVGYADGDVLKAAKMFVDVLPEVDPLVALVDFSAQEVTDSLRTADWFFNQAQLHLKEKILGIRLDTHGGRFAEGLDYDKSIETVARWLGVEGEYNIVEYVLGPRAFQLDPGNILVDKVRRVLFGSGVSVASIIHVRQALDGAGFNKVKIVASSGFSPQKCQIMGAAKAPIDTVGTGSFLPATFTETYATADIIAYDGVKRVKAGREFLFED
jgi:nicotinate phosphoribosyltransferase